MDNLNEEVVQNEEMGLFKRLVNIVFEPGKAFESIVSESKLLVPIILIVVVLALLAVPRAPIKENYTIDAVEKVYKSEAFLKTQQITPEQADKTIQLTGTISKVTTYLLPVNELAFMLIQALVFFIVFRILHGKGTFKQNFAVVVYAFFIQLVGEIVLTINMMISGNAETANSLGLLIGDPDKTNFIYNFLNSINFFTIWTMVVAAVGLSIVNGVPQKKSYITTFSIWGIWVLAYSGYVTINAVMTYKMYGVTM